MLKLKELFFDHEIFFDSEAKIFDYSFVRIRQSSNANQIMDLMKSASGQVNLYCDNVHLHQNNRTGKNTLEEIKARLGERYRYYWNFQDNRAIFYLVDPIVKNQEINQEEMKEELLKGYEETPITIKEPRKTENELFVDFID